MGETPIRSSLLASPVVRLVLVVAAAVSAGALSTRGGMWLDDHIHWQRLKAASWSYREIVDASTLDAATVRVKFWGTKRQVLRFYRPVSFAVMKAEWTLAGWRPFGMHCFSLLWHILVAYLVGMLAARITGDGVIGTVSSIFFAAFPGHMLTVYWIACQTEMMVAALCTASLLSYGRWAGWWDGSTGDAGGNCRRWSWLAVSVLLYMLALGCRENAIVLPAVIFLGDLFCRTVRRSSLLAWLCFGCAAAVYLLLRFAALGGMPCPGRPYLVRPDDPEFARFAIYKMLYYLSGLFLAIPVLPGTAMRYFAERVPLIYPGALMAVLVMGFAVSFIRRRAALVLPGWMFLAMLPVLPLAPASHHLYMLGIPAAVMQGAFLVGLGRLIRKRFALLGRAEPHLTRAAVAVLFTVMVAGSILYGWCFLAGTAPEHQVVADVLTLAEPPASGDEIFFINLPLTAFWVSPAIETVSGLQRLQAYVLTPADRPFIQTARTEITLIDRRTLRLRTEPPGWLVGRAGRDFADLCGLAWPLKPQQRIPGPAYDVVIERLSEAGGVVSLRFEFHEPIDKPGRHFYLGSFYYMAYPIRFVWEPRPVVVGPPDDGPAALEDRR